MSIGNDKAAKRHRSRNIRETSSPGKVYQSRASKPSAVAALGATADLSAVAGVYSDGNEPTGAEVDAAIQVSVDEVEARLDDVEAKIDELLAALKK
jgi:hypothetical protein